MAQVDEFLSKVVNDLGKSILARLRNGLNKSGNLGDPEPLHSSLSKPDQAELAKNKSKDRTRNKPVADRVALSSLFE